MRNGPYNDYNASGNFTIPITPIVNEDKTFIDIEQVKLSGTVHQYGTISFSVQSIDVTSNAIVCNYTARVSNNEAFPWYITLKGDWRIVEFY